MKSHLLSAAHLLLYEEDRLLMIRRFNTGYQDGNFSLVAGHVEPGEPVRHAMQREAQEEAGIDVATEDLKFVHIMHRRSGDGSERLDFFFRCTQWIGEVSNAEPHKCDLISWCGPGDLPANTVPYVSAALHHIQQGRMFSEFGWDD